MSDNVNPFAGLFTNENEEKPLKSPDDNQDKLITKKNIIEDIFGIRLVSSLNNTISDEKNIKQLIKIDAETIEDGIFERLTIQNIEDKLDPPLGSKNNTCDSHYLQNDVLPYLFESWSRLEKYKNDKSR